MAENSHISWTDNTFNPWMGCTKVSPACQHCYAERDMDHRYHKVAWGPAGTRVKTTAANWNKPLKWNCDATADHRPLVFCASLADVFEDWGGTIVNAAGQVLYRLPDGKYVPLEQGQFFLESREPATMNDLRRDLFKLIDATPNLDWLLLTKRPENVERMWVSRLDTQSDLNEVEYRENVILGTSIENQEWANRRLPYLHAAKRHGLVGRTFVSAEPLVGPIMLQGELDGLVYNHLGEGGIDWVITGGESGPDARPCDPEWFRSLRDQSEAAGVPFHFKQWGEFDETQSRIGKIQAGRILDGRTHDGMPRAETSRAREFPAMEPASALSKAVESMEWN